MLSFLDAMGVKGKKALFLAVLAAGTVFVPAFARAEGVICMSVDQDTRIQVFFNSKATAYDMPLRPQAMVVSDPTVSARNQVIAKFLASEGLITMTDNVITGFIDDRNPNTGRRGKRIGGTVLGSLYAISLEIDTSHQIPAQDGVRLAAQVIYTKRTGQQLSQDFDCVLYMDDRAMAQHAFDLPL
jgi:hypothetical protein